MAEASSHPTTVAAASRAFPSGGDYSDALQNTMLCFTDADLRDAHVEKTRLRQPRAISGNFASVFHLTSSISGRPFAIKCFTRNVPDQAVRYQKISEKLGGLDPATLSQRWKVGFDYLPEGILVKGERFPILKMDWVAGTSLSAWLGHNQTDPDRIARIAERFRGLVGDLADHGIAHGDLQHGNLLVAAGASFWEAC